MNFNGVAIPIPESLTPTLLELQKMQKEYTRNMGGKEGRRRERRIGKRKEKNISLPKCSMNPPCLSTPAHWNYPIKQGTIQVFPDYICL